MPRETGFTITNWAELTFGQGAPDELLWERANEEMQELLAKIKAGAEPWEIAKECADVVICLARIPGRLGYDIDEVRDYKMSVNRARHWIKAGNGVGQHKA